MILDEKRWRKRENNEGDKQNITKTLFHISNENLSVDLKRLKLIMSLAGVCKLHPSKTKAFQFIYSIISHRSTVFCFSETTEAFKMYVCALFLYLKVVSLNVRCLSTHKCNLMTRRIVLDEDININKI